MIQGRYSKITKTHALSFLLTSSAGPIKSWPQAEEQGDIDVNYPGPVQNSKGQKYVSSLLGPVSLSLGAAGPKGTLYL